VASSTFPAGVAATMSPRVGSDAGRRRVGEVAALRHREETLLAHRPQALVLDGGQHGLQFGLQLALLCLHLLRHFRAVR